MLATIVDSVVICLGSVVLWGAGLAVAALLGGADVAPGAVSAMVTSVMVALLPPAYLVIGWTRTGRTLGKVAFGLRVRRDDGSDLSVGRAVLRFVGYMASATILGAGFVMAAFTDRRRALHDMIAGTVVVREHR